MGSEWPISGVPRVNRQKKLATLGFATKRKTPYVTFSALDAESEAQVQEAIDNLANEKMTLIIIAHRLATIKNADQVSFIATVITE